MRDKSLDFMDSEIELAKFAKSMSHPARIRIVSVLLEAGGKLKCGDLVEQMPLAQSTVSQHLKELVKTDVLQVEQEGPACWYSLDRSKLFLFCRSFQVAMGNDNVPEVREGNPS